MSKFKTILFSGLAIFSIFFGAGNILFPAYLGYLTHQNYIYSILGFLLTAVGIPVSVLVIAIKFDGDYLRYYQIAGKKFAVILSIATIVLLGYLLASPRTATVAYEVGVLPFININQTLFMIIYFLTATFFVLNNKKVVEWVGKILTPLLIISLFIFIIKGIFMDVNSININNDLLDNAFINSISEGYLTMDALGTGFLVAIVFKSIKENVKDDKISVKIITKSSILAFTIISLVYTGFIYLGAKFSNFMPTDVTHGKLLANLCKIILGNYSIFLAVMVILACLTTVIGLSAMAGDLFANLIDNKIGYKIGSLSVLIFSFFVANLGLTNIIKMSVPLLFIIYPTTILITFFCYFEKYFDKLSIKIIIYLITIFNILVELLKLFVISTNPVFLFLTTNFAWIYLSIISIILALILQKYKRKD